jgi:hypothetical protein
MSVGHQLESNTLEAVMKTSTKKNAPAAPKVLIKGWDQVVGKKVLIRTVTYHYTGKVESVGDGVMRLSGAAWIADSGRFHQALKESKFEEVEPYVKDVLINCAAIVDVTEIDALPTTQK